MDVRIAKVSARELTAYESVSIAFEITSRIHVESLRESRGATLQEHSIPRRWKDYDASPSDRPTALASRWDTTNWAILVASDNDAPVGGAIMAMATPGLDMLEGRSDLALIFDFRVDPNQRGCGFGRALFSAAIQWARSHRCTELRVETQDVNVAACFFYSAMGCALYSIEENAYDGLDETKLIWRLYV